LPSIMNSRASRSVGANLSDEKEMNRPPKPGEDKGSPRWPIQHLSDELVVNRLPKLGEDKPSPLLWTNWPEKGLRSIVGAIPCGRPGGHCLRVHQLAKLV